jgi:hypothetical protein
LYREGDEDSPPFHKNTCNKPPNYKLVRKAISPTNATLQAAQPARKFGMTISHFYAIIRQGRDTKDNPFQNHVSIASTWNTLSRQKI